MRRPYTPGQEAAVAIIPVELPNGMVIDAKLDTGAELCYIFEGYIQGLTLEEAQLIDRRPFSGLTGNAEFNVYFITLRLDGHDYPVQVVAGRQQRNVLGMNLLNQLVTEFDGPNSHVTLAFP